MTNSERQDPGETARVKWQMNEGLLQQYRSLSMTVQSFILTVGTLVAISTMNTLYLVIILFVLGQVHLWWIWVRLVITRARVSDYYKYQVTKRLSSDEIIEFEKAFKIDDFVHQRSVRRAACTHLGVPMRGDILSTRVKLDVFVPVIYTLVWLVVLAIHMQTNQSQWF